MDGFFSIGYQVLSTYLRKLLKIYLSLNIDNAPLGPIPTNLGLNEFVYSSALFSRPGIEKLC